MENFDQVRELIWEMETLGWRQQLAQLNNEPRWLDAAWAKKQSGWS